MTTRRRDVDRGLWVRILMAVVFAAIGIRACVVDCDGSRYACGLQGGERETGTLQDAVQKRGPY